MFLRIFSFFEILVNFEAQKSRGPLLTQPLQVVLGLHGHAYEKLLDRIIFVTDYLHTKVITYSTFPSYVFNGGVFI